MKLTKEEVHFLDAAAINGMASLLSNTASIKACIDVAKENKVDTESQISNQSFKQAINMLKQRRAALTALSSTE